MLPVHLSSANAFNSDRSRNLSFGVNTVPNDKIFDRSKLKAFADDKLNVAEKLKFV